MILSNNRAKHLLVTSCLSLFLTACASNKVAVSDSIQQKSAQAAAEAKFTPEQAIDDAENKLIEAKKQGLSFFSPLHLKQAEESIAQAREYLVEPPEDMKNAPLMSAIAAQKYIENAYENKHTVEANLQESLKNLEILKQLNSPSLVPDQYQDVMESLTEVIEEIEQGKLTDAKQSEVDLIEDMIELEVDTLKVTHLNEAFSFYDRAADIEADEIAELSYEKASNTLDSAVNFIEKNYRDRKGVESAGIGALIAAKKAYFVAAETESLIKMKPDAAEKHMLEIMDLFNKIHLAAKGQDIIPDKLFNQSETIVNIIEGLKDSKPVAKPVSVENTSKTFAAPPSTELSVEPLGTQQRENPEANSISLNETEPNTTTEENVEQE